MVVLVVLVVLVVSIKFSVFVVVVVVVVIVVVVVVFVVVVVETGPTRRPDRFIDSSSWRVGGGLNNVLCWRTLWACFTSAQP